MKLDNEEKSLLRKEVLHKRNSMSHFEISMKSKLIQQNLIESPVFNQSKFIGLYLAIGSEVQTREIINYALDLGKTVLLPRIMSNDLRFYVVDQKDFEKNSFDVNRFGIKEPEIDNKPADFIDLLIIPGIVFDMYGFRIGYGYGYYDKYLTNNKFSKSIGLAYDFQLIKKTIPILPHDRKIDVLITESGFHVFNSF
ncbi:MAG: 5-formyltetrahydrofolate cyclo-ligase [Nitrososphaeraceae archaeon]